MTVVRPSLSCSGAIVVAERVAGEGIERAERLVHQHDPRPRRERARDADALALAAGQFVRKAVAILRAVEPHQIEQFVDPRAISAAGTPNSFGVIPILPATLICGNSPPLWNT